MSGRHLVAQDIVVLADDVWAAPKRARHKAPLAWARAGNRVLWVETPYPTERSRQAPDRTLAVEPDFFVSSPAVKLATHASRRRPWHGLQQPLLQKAYATEVHRAIARINLRPDWLVVWQEPRLVFALDAIDPLARTKRIYYASDHFVDVSGRGEERRLLQRCLDRVHIVFATSAKIATVLSKLHPQVHHIPHAVDLDWWSEADRSPPPDLGWIPHPRFVFAGVGTIKFDLDLWGNLARRRPDWHLVTIGPFHTKLRASPSYAEVAKLPNVHFLGERPYASLPAYLDHADVLTCPYRVDLVRTASGLPNKFYEYAIAEKPILSTPFTEFEANLPQLLVLPPEKWPEIELEALPSGKGSVEGHTYSDRVEMQRRILAALF